MSNLIASSRTQAWPITLMFVAALAWAWWPKNRQRFESAAHIPLKDEDA